MNIANTFKKQNKHLRNWNVFSKSIKQFYVLQLLFMTV